MQLIRSTPNVTVLVMIMCKGTPMKVYLVRRRLLAGFDLQPAMQATAASSAACLPIHAPLSQDEHYSQNMKHPITEHV